MRFLSLLIMSCLLVFSSGGSANERRQAGEILLGMSTALTGPAADLGMNMLHGVRAGLERANREGGVMQRHIKVLPLDDGYEPARTAPNMRKLIEQHNVLAVIGNVGTPTAIAAIPIANESKTLLFAPFTGAGVLRKTPPDRYVINYRASYAQETAAMIDALVVHAGIRPEEIAFFTQRDAYGDAGFSGGVAALRRHGLMNEYSIVHTRYQRNTLAVENAVADILVAKPRPRAVVMVGAYKPCAKFIKMARKAGIVALFLNVSFVGSAPLARELGQEVDNIIVTQVVPHPDDISLKLVRNFRQDMQALYPDAALSFGALEGYIASRIFVEALLSLDKEPDRENIIDALEQLGQFRLDDSIDLRLDDDTHQASDRIWPTILKNGRFEPLEWKQIRQLVVASP